MILNIDILSLISFTDGRMSLDISYRTFSSIKGLKFAYVNDGSEMSEKRFQVIYNYIYTHNVYIYVCVKTIKAITFFTFILYIYKIVNNNIK